MTLVFFCPQINELLLWNVAEDYMIVEEHRWEALQAYATSQDASVCEIADIILLGEL